MPNSISQNLQRLIDAKDAITTAITNKGGIVNSGDGFEEFAEDIATIPSGGGSSKAVRFFDYDGTMICDYSPEEFLALSSMPANPTHEGLTAQGWNWSLSDAKEYVTANGCLEIGQLYNTNDGKTRFFIEITDDIVNTNIYMDCAVKGSIDVDWGDGSSHSTITGNSSSTRVGAYHSYTESGNYVLSLAITGTAYLVPSSNYSDAISCIFSNKLYILKKAFIGDNLNLSSHAFDSCTKLENIILSRGTISPYAFRHCDSLISIIVPSNVQSYAFQYAESLSSICLPKSSVSPSSTFTHCYSLERITISSSSSSNFSDDFLYLCTGLTELTIPSNITSLSESFIRGCTGLKFLKFTRSSPPTISRSGAWDDLPRSCIIYVPQGSLEAYKSSVYYPSSTNYTYIEY